MLQTNQHYRSVCEQQDLNIDLFKSMCVCTVTDFIFLSSKFTVILTRAMKLKDTFSLEEKVWQT